MGNLPRAILRPVNAWRRASIPSSGLQSVDTFPKTRPLPGHSTLKANAVPVAASFKKPVPERPQWPAVKPSSAPALRVQGSSFSLAHACPVQVKVGLLQAGSGSGLLTRPASATAGVVARKELKVYFLLPHVRPVQVKVGLLQAGSGSGLLTYRPLRPRVSQSPTVGASPGDLRSAERQWSGDPRRTKRRSAAPPPLAAGPAPRPSAQRGHYPLVAGTQNGCEPVGSAGVYRMNPQLPE